MNNNLNNRQILDMNKKDIRVKAILWTADNTIVVIRRERNSQAPYRVFPGGGLEPTDKDEIAALHREIREELCGKIIPLKRIYILRRDLNDGRQQEERFWLCNILSWDTNGGTGNEWKIKDPDNVYSIEEIKLSSDALLNANLKPEEVRDLLMKNKNLAELQTIEVVERSEVD